MLQSTPINYYNFFFNKKLYNIYVVITWYSVNATDQVYYISMCTSHCTHTLTKYFYLACTCFIYLFYINFTTMHIKSISQYCQILRKHLPSPLLYCVVTMYKVTVRFILQQKFYRFWWVTITTSIYTWLCHYYTHTHEYTLREQNNGPQQKGQTIGYHGRWSYNCYLIDYE